MVYNRSLLFVKAVWMTLDQPQCVITPKHSYWMQWSQFHGRLHSLGQWDRVMSKATLESYPSTHTLLLQMMRTYFPACGGGYWVFVKRFWTVGKAAFLMLNNALWPMPRSWRMQQRTSAMSAFDPLKIQKKGRRALGWIGDALWVERGGAIRKAGAEGSWPRSHHRKIQRWEQEIFPPGVNTSAHFFLVISGAACQSCNMRLEPKRPSIQVVGKSCCN